MEKDDITGRRCELLLIGGSAGSIDALLKILPGIKKQISFAIVIVLHRKKSADSGLSDLFGLRTSIPVKELEDKDSLQPGVIYLAPADYHLLFEKNKSASLDYSEKVNYSRPSIDVAFESATHVYGSALICLLLSGANADGSAGLTAVKQKGGRVAVQDPKTADSPYMPQHAITVVGVKNVFSPEEIVVFINSI